MDVGILLIFQNFMGRLDDGDVLDGEIRLGLLAEELGFDSLWPPEHHFTDYSACPDNIQFLSWSGSSWAVEDAAEFNTGGTYAFTALVLPAPGVLAMLTLAGATTRRRRRC